MISVPVFNMNGQQSGAMEIDEKILGESVNIELLKQAVVSWRISQRQGSARTKSRGMVEGSTRKLFRQKGTGNARMGTVRTPIRRGGGVAFAKREQNFRRPMPQKMRRTARNHALLAKLTAGNVAILDFGSLTQAKTKPFAQAMKAVGGDQGCVVAMEKQNDVIWKSGRNIPKTDIRLVHELNAYEILRRRKLFFTPGAFKAVVADPQSYRPAQEAER